MRRIRHLVMLLCGLLTVLLLAETASVGPIGGDIALAASLAEARRPETRDHIDPVTGRPKGKTAAPAPKINARFAKSPQDVAWPNPGVAVLDVADAAAERSGGPSMVGDLPVKARPPEDAKARSKGKPAAKVKVAVLDRKVAEQAGLPGPVLSVTRADGGTDAAPVRLEIDYSSFAAAAGDFASRLRLIQVPACGLASAEPQDAECRSYGPLPSDNTPGKKRLVAEVIAQPDPTPGQNDDENEPEESPSPSPYETPSPSETTQSSPSESASPAREESSPETASPSPSSRTAAASPSTEATKEASPSASPSPTESPSPSEPVEADPLPQVVVALAASAGGPAGDFKATSLAPSASWQVGGNSGSFQWSYPLPVTELPGGLSPDLALSYDSGSIDGRTSATNNQASWIGDGWDLSTGFIERQYKTCSDDGHDSKGKEKSDLCWHGDNMMLSLPGHAGPFFKAADGTYRIKNDDGTRIERKTGGWGNTRNGEYWVVTTTDGTRYVFGRGRRSADDAHHQLSAWHAPVFGDDSGEPCHASTFAASACTQGWRWNLDHVVDTHGNSMTLFYTPEYNFYGQNRNDKSAAYVRGGYLSRIEYGTRAGSDMVNGAANAQMTFTVAERCFKSADVNCTPEELNTENQRNWPDTPYDQICTSSSSCPDTFGPAFFSRKRLTDISSQVRAGGAWTDVDQWHLGQGFPSTQDGTSAPLWLSEITRTGKTGGTITVPKVTFDGMLLRGRVDTATDDLPAMNRWRIRAILSESGARTNVNYATPDCGPGDVGDIKPESNWTQCYPIYWTPEGHTDPQRDWWHKYVVESVIDDERTTGGTDVETRYEYRGNEAWHYDQSQVQVPARKTWSEWRGYQWVRTTVGAKNQTQTQTETTYLRGMDGDLRSPDGGLRDISVTPTEGDPVEDIEQLAGYELEEKTYTAPGGSLHESMIHRPWVSAVTAGSGAQASRMTNVFREDGRERRNDGTWRRTATATSFDKYGMPTQTSDIGDADDGTDNRCIRTSYARNAAKWILEPVAHTEVVNTGCSGTINRPDGVITDERYSYDGQPYGTAPVKGDVTRKEEATGYTGDTPAYQTVQTSRYDAAGRQVEAVDAAGKSTITAFTPNSHAPATAMTVTNPLGHATATTIDPLRGHPTTVTDPNGRKTVMTYDALGRSSRLWLPGRSTASVPDVEYGYAIRQDAPSTVVAKTLTPNGNTAITVQLFDGLLRERQTQTAAPGGGRVIADTKYDSRGEPYKKGSGIYNTAAPSTTLLGVDDNETAALTVTTFDQMGRPIADIFKVNGTEKWRTTKSYDAGIERVTPPAGGTPTATYTSVRDHVTQIRYYHGDTPSGDHDAITYTYARNELLGSITDQAGNKWSYGYDVRDRKTTATDPDKGTTSYTYDTRDRLTSAKDARGATIAYAYDDLGRKTAAHEGSLSGAKRAEWRYDKLPDGTIAKGTATGSTRFYGEHGYATDITAIDAAGRPTQNRVSIPSVQGKLAGSYTFATSYKPDGTPDSVTLPAAGGLPEEIVSTTFNELGMPITTGGADDYVSATRYSKLGEALQVTMAGGSAKQSWLTWYYQEGTRRLDQIQLDRQSNPNADTDLNYTYDPAGNITSITDAAPGKTERQCFTYDYLKRLKHAWAQAGTADCAANPAKDVLGGPAPYWNSFTYDTSGNRATETRHQTTGDTTRTYKYPAPGTTGPADGNGGPHAVTTVTQDGPDGSRLDQYDYDKTGNTTSRQHGDTTQTLTWDEEGLLTKTVEDGKETSFVYDADGNRIIRTDPAATTLYLPGMELKTSGDTVKCTRYYSHGDQTVAVRDAGGLTFQAADHHGTTSNQIAATDDQKLVQRRFLPFGNPRGTADQTDPLNPLTGGWTGEKGYVGGTYDTTTGLTHLGAREYDPSLGRFISVDPLLDPANPHMLDAYGYAANSPITASDPDGDVPIFRDKNGGTHQMRPNGKGGWKRPRWHWKKKPEPKYSNTGRGRAGAIIDSVAANLPVTVRERFKAIAWRKFWMGGDLFRPNETHPLRYWINKAKAAALSACNAIGDDGCGRHLMNQDVSEGKALADAINVIGEQALMTFFPVGRAARLLQNRTHGDAARDAIAARYPGSRTEVTYVTPGGARRVDVVTPGGVGIESKVGRTYWTRGIRRQVEKDKYLLKSGRLKQIEWRFSPSPVTGRSGPSPRLRKALEDAGIMVR